MCKVGTQTVSVKWVLVWSNRPNMRKKRLFGGHFGGLGSGKGVIPPKIENRARNIFFVIFVNLSIFLFWKFL